MLVPSEGSAMAYLCCIFDLSFIGISPIDTLLNRPFAECCVVTLCVYVIVKVL